MMKDKRLAWEVLNEKVVPRLADLGMNGGITTESKLDENGVAIIVAAGMIHVLGNGEIVDKANILTSAKKITFYLEKDIDTWVVDAEEIEFERKFDKYEDAVYFCKHLLKKEANVTYYEVYDINNAGKAIFEESGRLWVTSQYGGEDTKYMEDTWIKGCPVK